MNPVLFTIGSKPVYAYGVSLTLAFLLGAWIGVRRARRFGVASSHIYQLTAWAFLSAIVGSRALYLAAEQPSKLAQPVEWFRVWEGGLVFYGGFIAAVGSSVLYALASRISFWTLADILAPSIAIGHGIVRIGCFLNGCCYGRPALWGVVFPSLGDHTPRQPTQLYESAAGLGLFAILLIWERRMQRQPGELLLLYVAAYGALRFLIELVRDDDRGPRIAGLTISQILGLAALLIGGTWLLRRRAVRRNVRPLPSRKEGA